VVVEQVRPLVAQAVNQHFINSQLAQRPVVRHHLTD
jgi:hypothetical protein